MKITIGEIILSQALVRSEQGKYSHRYQKENKRTTALQDGMDKWKMTERLMKEYRKW